MRNPCAAVVWIRAAPGPARGASWCAALTLCAVVAVAAAEPSGDSQAEPTEPAVSDVRLVYSVSRVVERPFDTGRAVEVVTREDLWRLNARTLPEALMETTGIFVQQTDYGAGSPVLRGLIGKQVLILVDGVKVNNATYRLGPNQYLATIDLDMVERIEIIRGAGAIQGSDAFGGGVINVITRRGPAANESVRLGGRITSRVSSADEAASGRAEVFGRTERWRYLGGATYRYSSDVKGGGDIGRQAATGYDEWAGNASVEYYPSPAKSLTLTYLRLDQRDVPRTDRVTDGTNLVFNYDPQRLQLATVAYQDLTLRRWADSLRFTVFWNRQDEGNREVRMAAPAVERLFDDSQTLLGLNIEASVSSGKHRLAYGFEASTESIDSSRRDVNQTSGAVTTRRGKYTDGATYGTIALYAAGRVRAAEWLSVLLSARLNRSSIGGSESTSVGVLNLDSTKSALTGGVRGVAHITRQVNLSVAVNRGFRAPNIDDISIFDERGAQGTEVPNPAVGPERLVMAEAGLAIETGKLSASAFYHYGGLDDLLVRAAGTFNGLSFFDTNGNGVRDDKEVPVLQKQNIGQATIQGFEVALRYRPVKYVTLFGNLTRTVGDDTSVDPTVPLSRIPPVFGTAGVRWQSTSRRREWAEIVCLFAGAQRRVSAADITDTRIGKGGTGGFSVIHLRGGLSLGKHMGVRVAVENVTDAAYKYHGSGVYRPGLQGVGGIELRF
jgi:hemoglobin/transferrin/lactoferrin receptor protein